MTSQSIARMGRTLCTTHPGYFHVEAKRLPPSPKKIGVDSESQRLLLLLSTNWYLSCAEDSVTSITQAGENVVLLVEALIERREVDIYVGVLLLDSCHALG